MAIVDQYGNPLNESVLHEPQTAKLFQLHREYANHPSRGLTPARLAAIMQQAEQGHLMAQAELFADMEEKDAHLFAEMAKRKGAIQSIDWEIKPPRNASAAEKSLADYLTELAQDLPSFDNVMFDALDGVGHGYSCQEIEWQMLGKEWFPKAITHRLASWFCTPQDNQNEVRLRDNTTNGAELLPFGWITHKHKARTGILARSGLHRVLAWPYLFKNYAIRDLAELIEIYGLPIRLGKYPPGTSDTEKATLLRAVTQLGHSAAGIIPESMAIEFETAASGTHDIFEAMINWAERSMSKAILGATLTSQADGKTSTNALGSVHNEVRREILASDAKQLAATLTRDILYPLAVLNGKAVEDMRRMPRLVFDVQEEEDFQMLANSLPPLVNIGLPIPITWAQQKLAIPAPQNGEAVLTPQKPLNTAATKLAALSFKAPDAQPSLPKQDEYSEAWADVVKHIQQLVAESKDLVSLQEALTQAYAGLPLDDLTNIMAQGFALAHLAGMFDVKTGQ